MTRKTWEEDGKGRREKKELESFLFTWELQATGYLSIDTKEKKVKSKRVLRIVIVCLYGHKKVERERETQREGQKKNKIIMAYKA